MLWIILAILAVIGAIVLTVLRSSHNTNVRNQVMHKKPEISQEDLKKILAANAFPVPGAVNTALIAAAAIFFAFGLFNKVFFYAEPGYQYHVRTILGQEKAVDDVGYNMYLFGYVNAWKKALTVQSTDIEEAVLNTENDSSDLSANLPAQNLTFLDQVDANVEATVRFRLPEDDESFLRLAREYRTPENLLRTSLVPAFRETLQANASLMNAEEYFTGGRTSFNRDFEDQMQNGIYIVRRVESERTITAAAGQDASANAALGQNQVPLTPEEDRQVILEVVRLTDAAGVPLRKEQAFSDWGISVIEARITDVDPNTAFKERMSLRQKASADRSIARERRVQQEEERLLAIATADREVAQRQGTARVAQIEQTTNAETTKQLAITLANQQLEQAEIDRATAQINLERARIDAQSVRVAAEAEAFRREAVIEADNALQQKLDAEIQIQQVWADAFARRNVPSVVMTGGEAGGLSPTGSNSEATDFMRLLTIDAARRLAYDREVAPAAAQR